MMHPDSFTRICSGISLKHSMRRSSLMYRKSSILMLIAGGSSSRNSCTSKFRSCSKAQF